MKTLLRMGTSGTVLISVLTFSVPTVFGADAYLNVGTAVQATSSYQSTDSFSPINAPSAVGGEFSLTQGSVDVGELREGDTEEELPVSSEWVESEEDLRAYAGVVMRTQPHIEELTVSKEAVSLKVRDEARLFGLLSIAFPVTIEADVTGEVRVHYPWYSFATSNRSDVYEVNIKSYIEPLYEDSQVLTSEGSFSAYGQALVVDEMLEAYAKPAL